MQEPELYMLLLGATPPGRLTEQHDIFFGIGRSLKELVPQILASWPEAKGKVHIDAWRKVTSLNGYKVAVTAKENGQPETEDTPAMKLFFLNLGGYKKDEFDEFHYKLLIAAENSSEAIKAAKQTAFYMHMGFKSATSKGATSHIDEKYALDVDDFHRVADVLPAFYKEQFSLKISKEETEPQPDEINLGYFILSKLMD